MPIGLSLLNRGAICNRLIGGILLPLVNDPLSTLLSTGSGNKSSDLYMV